MARLVKVFISYQHSDGHYADALLRHLQPLVQEGTGSRTRGWRLEIWQDRQNLLVGDKLTPEIDHEVKTTDLFVCLISAHYFSSEWCQLELSLALETPTVRVVPILVSPCDIEGSVLSDIVTLPEHLQMVSQWPDEDAAWTTCVKEIRRLLDRTNPKPLVPVPASEPGSRMGIWLAIGTLCAAVTVGSAYLVDGRPGATPSLQEHERQFLGDLSTAAAEIGAQPGTAASDQQMAALMKLYNQHGELLQKYELLHLVDDLRYEVEQLDEGLEPVNGLPAADRVRQTSMKVAQRCEALLHPDP